MKAPELTLLAAQWLREQHPLAHIRTEFSVAAYGGALVDVAAILPDQIIGVEIKGEGDSTTRLRLQGNMYSRVCRKMFLLPSPTLLDKARKHCPPEWDLLTPPGLIPGYGYRACPKTGIVYRNRAVTIRGEGLGLSPAALAEMIWTKEYIKFRDHINPDAKLPKTKKPFREHVTKTYPLPWIEEGVCQTLRSREWFDGKTILPDQEIEPLLVS